MSYNYYYDEQSQDETSSSEASYKQESQEQAGYPRMMSATPSDVMDVVADSESSGAQYQQGSQTQQGSQYSSDDSESAA